MQQVWEAINEGANAYLKRQLTTILPIVLILTVALFFSVYLIEPTEAAIDEFPGLDPVLMVAIGRTVAFVMGASFQ
jgi:K(+)-stimulated pyrophosphate-energized sodium pump